MFLKNYTSDVPVSQTIYRIEQVLIRCGVSGITKEYGPPPDGEVIALTFHIDFEGKPLTIRLPADKDKAHEALWLDYVDDAKLASDGKSIERWSGSKKKKTKAHFKEQAERTAWKLVQDWVEVQMSMIQMKQADTAQVFLPYVLVGKQSFYHALRANNFKALLPEKVA